MKQRARVVRDLPAIKLIGRQLGPFAVGDEVELEDWEEAVLERHGLVEPIQKISLMGLRKLTLAEEREFGPAPLPAGFYSRVIQNISSLRAAGKHEEATEIGAQASALLELRIPKLIRLALSPESAGELPPEERFLINRLASMLDNWSKQLKESLEKAGEEVGENEELGGPVRRAVGKEADIQKPGVPAPELHTGGTAPQG